MSLFIYTLGALIIFSPLASASTNCSSLANIDWILGSWSSKSTKRTYQESWSKISNDTYEGHSQVTLVNGKNVGYESLRLVVMAGEVFYLAKVTENELPIAFKLVSCTRGSLHFQNLKHDFPQSIKYFRNSENSFSVSVEGKENKGFRLNFLRNKVKG